VREGLALLEITGLSPALVALDALEKASGVRLVQMELNDFYGVLIKVAGTSAELRTAVDAGRATVEGMHGTIITTILDAPDDGARSIVLSKAEYSPLMEAPVVFEPAALEESSVSDNRFAIGLIETQGFTAALEAIDCACKAADVEPVGKEKLGGGYITVVFRGDVAAVQTAVEVGKAHVEGLGKLIAAHVITRPSDAVLSLLPKS
jgi:microcompartment protein CcmL/EutN